MDKKELYKAMQALWVEENDVRVGDKVRVLRPHRSYELGSIGAAHDEEELLRRGKEGVVNDIGRGYVQIALAQDDHFLLAFHQLEIVDQPRDPVITVKYFKDGKDVTDQISPDTKRNLANA